MDKERIQNIQEHAQAILNGDADNYDGADAARIIDDLCDALLSCTDRIT